MMHSTEWTMRFIKAMTSLGEEDHDYTFRVQSGATGKPRASSLGSCGRKQYYALTDTPRTEDAGIPWAPMMGFAGESIVRETLRRMGYDVHHVELPDDLVFSGHVDDVLIGLDLDVPTVWDNKVRGAYGMRMLITKRLPAADVDMYLQMQAYMYALGVSQALLTIVPHDLSMMRREVKSYKLYVDSPLVYRIMVQADKEAQALAVTRATELEAARSLGVMVRREFNPANNAFPCTYCEWRTRCTVDDYVEDQLQLTPIPEAWTAEE